MGIMLMLWGEGTRGGALRRDSLCFSGRGSWGIRVSSGRERLAWLGLSTNELTVLMEDVSKNKSDGAVHAGKTGDVIW